MSTRLLLATLLFVAASPRLAVCQQLSPAEKIAVSEVDARSEAIVDLLERLVNINSGTHNPAGVSAVADVLEPEFRALGFETKRLSMDSVKRGPHLIATRTGTRGKRLMLIGHMDTVFEPSNPFQRFVRSDATATGPGVRDDKGGVAVMLLALQGLHKAGLLDGTTITVFLTGDEEAVGNQAISRKEFLEVGKRSDAALCFEGGIRIGSQDYITVARRGSVGWELKAEGTTAHSSGIFSPERGDGAAYEISRILTAFHAELREPQLTYNVGLLLAGTSPTIDADGTGQTSGKRNIIPGEAIAIGDIRAVDVGQLERTKERMRAIVEKNLPGTKARITFEEGYPPMAATDGNRVLAAVLNGASEALGFPALKELDPMQRGAADISFVAPYVDSLSGLGATGDGDHAAGEHVDLSRLPTQAKRAAVLMHRLTR